MNRLNNSDGADISGTYQLFQHHNVSHIRNDFDYVNAIGSINDSTRTTTEGTQDYEASDALVLQLFQFFVYPVGDFFPCKNYCILIEKFSICLY